MAFSSEFRRRPDGGNQRHAPRGRDVGAADHLHDHGAADVAQDSDRPAAGQSERAEQNPPEPIDLAVKATGDIFWNDEPVTEAMLQAQLRVAAQKHSTTGAANSRRQDDAIPAHRNGDGRCQERRHGQDRIYHDLADAIGTWASELRGGLSKAPRRAAPFSCVSTGIGLVATSAHRSRGWSIPRRFQRESQDSCARSERGRHTAPPRSAHGQLTLRPGTEWRASRQRDCAD